MCERERERERERECVGEREGRSGREKERQSLCILHEIKMLYFAACMGSL